jgi:hypothetical protein
MFQKPHILPSAPPDYAISNLQEHELQHGGNRVPKGNKNGSSDAARDIDAAKDTDKPEEAGGSQAGSTSPYGAISATLNWDMFYIVLNLWRGEVGLTWEVERIVAMLCARLLWRHHAPSVCAVEHCSKPQEMLLL